MRDGWLVLVRSNVCIVFVVAVYPYGTHLIQWHHLMKDTDEYIVPMGKFNSIGDVSEYLDRKGMHIAEFKSSPAKPRFNLLE